MTNIWRSVPIFVSSTFVDMHDERDYLRRFVFPELEERLRQRNCYLEPIDLRWGVSPELSDGGEHAMEMAILSVCFEEIIRGGALVIGLLGDRYGWIPPSQALLGAASAAGFKDVPECRSITELELTFALQIVPNNVLVYCRDPLPHGDMPQASAQRYSEAYDHSPDREKKAARLNGLKSQIAEQQPSAYKTYPATWREATDRLEGFEELGRQLVEDAWSILDPQTRIDNTSNGEPFSEDIWEIEQFAGERCRVFLGRTSLLERVQDACLAPHTEGVGRSIFLKGPPGCGKSAVFSRLRQLLLYEPILLLEHAVGISKSSTLPSRIRERWTQTLGNELSKEGVEITPLSDAASEPQKKAHFISLLAALANRKRIVLLVDSLESLQELNDSRRLQWLPDRLPENVVLVATVLDGLVPEFSLANTTAEEVEIPPLRTDEAKSIIIQLFKLVGRTPTPEVVDILLNKLNGDRTIAAGSPLWLSMAVSELNELDALDFQRADEFAGQASARLQQLIIQIARELPEEISSLYDWLIDRLEETHGARTTKELLNLIAVSRSGLRESDFNTLMAGTLGVSWSSLSFARLRRSLRSHIVQRGSDAQWTFAHEQMRVAIRRRNMSRAEVENKLNRKIALMLMSRPVSDKMRTRETLHHLLESGGLDMAAIYLANENAELGGYEAPLELLKFAASKSANVIQALLQQPTLDDSRRFKLCYLITIVARDASDGGVALSNLATSLKVVEATLRGPLRGFGMNHGNDSLYSEVLSLCRTQLASTLFSMGYTHEAMQYSEASIDEQTPNVENVGPADRRQHTLIRHFRTLGDFHRWKNEQQQSLKAHGNAVRLARQLTQGSPSDIEEAQRALLVSLSHQYMAVHQFRAGSDDSNQEPPAELGEMILLADDILAKEPESVTGRMDKVMALGHLTHFYCATKQQTLALQTSLESLDLAQSVLNASPDEPHFKSAVATQRHDRASVLKQCKRSDEALIEFGRAVAMLNELAASDSENVRWRQNLVASVSALAGLMSESGRNEEALSFASRAEREARWLTIRTPQNANFSALLHRSRGQVCRSLMELGRKAEAKEVLCDMLGICLQTDGSLPKELPIKQLSDLNLIHAVFEIGEPSTM